MHNPNNTITLTNIPSNEYITYDSSPDEYYHYLGILKDNIVQTFEKGLNQLYKCMKLELSRLNSNDELNMLIDYFGGEKYKPINKKYNILMCKGKDYYILSSDIFDNSKPIVTSRHHYVVVTKKKLKKVKIGKFEVIGNYDVHLEESNNCFKRMFESI